MGFSPWVPVLVSVAVVVLGLASHAVTLSFFLGKMKAEQAANEKLVAAFQTFTKDTIGALLARMHTLDEFASDSSSDRAALTARMTAVERNTDGLQQLREDFAAFRAEQRAHNNRAETDIGRIHLSLDGVQRQLGNLAVHGPGQLVELKKGQG